MLESKRSTRLRSVCITAATIWLLTCLMAGCFTGASYVYTWVRYPRPVFTSHPYSPRARAKALHSLSPSAAASLFGEFDDLEASRTYEYQPWVGFSERSFHSPLLNIDDGEPLPIRRTLEARDDTASDRTIWLFGGSTLFGWGVPDSQTIASYLSAILSTDGVHYTVVNYGHTQFYSSQEAVLFATLLRHGHRCDIAIFLDGLNDSLTSPNDRPTLTGQTAVGFLEAEDQATAERSKYIIVTPLFPPVRVIRGLLRRFLPISSRTNLLGAGEPKEKYDPVAIYRFNVSMIQEIAAAENIGVLLYWQPTPFDYIGGAEQRRASRPESENIPFVNIGVRQCIKTRSFHFIADLFEGESFEDVYVDAAHYGDKGSLIIAQMIAQDVKKMVGIPSHGNPSRQAGMSTTHGHGPVVMSKD